MMGAGIDALTVRNIDPRAKNASKSWRSSAPGSSRVSAEAPFFLVRADGREYHATFFVAGNSRYYAAHVSIAPSADPTDGLLDLLLFTGTTRSSLAAFWLGVPSGLHLRNPNVMPCRQRGPRWCPSRARRSSGSRPTASWRASFRSP